MRRATASWMALGAALTMGITTGCMDDSIAPAAGDQYQAKRTAILGAGSGLPLTLPQAGSAPAIIRDFVRDQHVGTELGTLATERESHLATRGLTHVRMTQEIDGLRVHGAYVKATVDDQGALVHIIDNLASAPAGGLAPAGIGEDEALRTVLALHHPAVDPGTMRTAGQDGNTTAYAHDGTFHREPTVTRVAVPFDSGAMQEGFLVETWTEQDNMLRHTLVSGAGRVLDVELRTNTDSYNIFAEHPGTTAQQIVSGPGTGNTESPVGWLFASGQRDIDIAGNNIHAYLDRDNNGAPDSGGTSVTDGSFVAVADLTQEPETATNQAVAVQNLFYLNNLIHDKLYHHGFTEAAGNFQEDNFGLGGSGSDSVNTEAQDGGGTDNANFSTPSDGSNPRMQMYLWTKSTPKRDGDVDSDVVWHEYGHGLTWRMIGSMSGPLSGALGEGMSDVLAILANDNDVVGEYSYNNAIGIRSEPYTGYSRTYGDVAGSSVHFDGEVYAATIWRLWGLFQENGLSKDTLYDYLVGGMNFTPAGPAYEDMRDGILQAAAGTGHECLIWEAFAQFGIGDGADGSVSGGGGPFGGGTVTIVESFALPSTCGGTCSPTESPEQSCSDGLDNDCDGLTDSNDSDCGGGTCTPSGASCTANSDCCSSQCKGRSGSKTCK